MIFNDLTDKKSFKSRASELMKVQVHVSGLVSPGVPT